MSRQMTKKKKGFPFFWLFYFVFVLAMVIFWIRVGDYVKKSLVIYEESQPKYAMEKIMTLLRQNGLDQYMTIEGEVSRFETSEAFSEEFQGNLKGKILFFDEAKGYQDPSAPRYELFADGDPVGFVTLKETSSQPFFINLLTLSEWALDKVEMPSIKGEKSVEVTVPDNYQVKINGILADEREQQSGSETASEFEYASAYVTVPSFVTYRVDGLLKTPNVEILNANGESVSFESTEKNEKTLVSLKEFAESEMPSELETMVLENAERYTNYFSVDLPGAKQSTRPIRDLFPEDSYYLELAETYRREDMWMYSDHAAPVFKNESVSHYVRYNDECFSCEVYFEKEMRLTKTGKIKVDVTNFRLYYGLLNGEWKIVDIVTLLNNA
ncbi:MAG: hypothetical protein J6Z22_04035 [Lachnospiraceae bacterium]|nr:hypothetical protein [Lachnospiraceae bacterium]